MSVDKRLVRLYDVGEVAKKLSKEQPFFTMAGGGVYAIQTRNKRGKEVPTNFIRISKKRILKGKDRKKDRIAARRRIKEVLAKNEVPNVQ